MNDAGRIGFVVRGEYDSSATYDFLDVVFFGNSSYVAKKTTIGNEPAKSNEYWQILTAIPDITVTGVKGAAESKYRKGDINITPENIGLGKVDNTADKDKSVAQAAKATQDGKGNNIAETYAKKDFYANGSENGGISVGAGLSNSKYVITTTMGTLTCNPVYNPVNDYKKYPGTSFNDWPTMEYKGETYVFLDANISSIPTWAETETNIMSQYDITFSGHDTSFSSPSESLDAILFMPGSTPTIRFMKFSEKPYSSNSEDYLEHVLNDKKLILTFVERNESYPYQTHFGTYNAIHSGNKSVLPILAVGNGTANNKRSNAFRVTHEGGVYATKEYNSSGADYAEFIKPWFDGNKDGEDRVGFFVTLKKGKLYLANEGDYIAGIISGNPSVVGNSDEDYYWRYERDDFNRIVMEDAPEMVQQTDEDGNPVYDEETNEPVMVETGRIIKNARMKLADGYDITLQNAYIERKDRLEWDYVGMVGVLPLRDDGTCLQDHFCKCGQDGVATLATERGFDTFYVIERINDHVVSVILR